MDKHDLINYFGYLGSILIALSMLMSNVKKLRIINLIGNTIFATYGLFLELYPILAVNLFIMIVNIYYLLRMLKTSEYLTLNETLKGDEYFFKQFLDYYKNDISINFPEFKFNQILEPKIILISRKLNPVGLFVYELLEGGIIKIHLDYACPQYRDYKNIKHLYKKKKEDPLLDSFHTLSVESSVPSHQKYLKKIGFVQNSKDGILFSRRLN